jgi:hypothetical protein
MDLKRALPLSGAPFPFATMPLLAKASRLLPADL